MSFALTENSKLVCAHQGQVQLTASQSRLTVSGGKVLVEGDLNSAPVSACTTTPTAPPPPGTPVSTKCLTVTSTINGVAAKLKIQGKGALLDNIQGTTDGIVANTTPQSWSVQSANETKLSTV